MIWRGVLLGLKFQDIGSINDPRVSLTIWSEKKLVKDFITSLEDEIAYRNNWSLDLTEFNNRFSRDPQLGPVIERWRGMKPLNLNSLYEYVIIAIMLQNATVRRSVNMLQSLFENYGTLVSFDGKELYCFWEPKALLWVTEEELRELRVGYRAKSIKRVTDSFIREEINELDLRKQSWEVQGEALLALCGVGPASVSYILSDVFHHMDEMSHISPWEQKIYSELFFDREPEDPVSVKELLKIFDERYMVFRCILNSNL
jgi:3-methyladenine DNA glycosylase/8-oxoguanine DNA glycosylase